MKELSIEKMAEVQGGGSNCGGTYNACIITAAVAGVGFTLFTSGLGSYFGVIIAAAGMEYCRQQAIGCYGPVLEE